MNDRRQQQSSAVSFTPITVLGAGSWGTALALLLANNGSPVRLWSYDKDHAIDMQKTHLNRRYFPKCPFPEKLKVTHRLDEALNKVQDVLVVVPSHVFTETLEKSLPYFSNYPRLVWGTKGIDLETRGLLDQTVENILEKKIPMAIISGPTLAKDVAAQLPTAVNLACNDISFSKDLIDRLHCKTFRIYPTDDLIGVQLCGAVKNVLGIAAGISDGLELGGNARSALITRGLVEIGRLSEAVGGRHKTLLDLAGLGDIVLTCTDDRSRNRRFGLLLADGLTVNAAAKEIGQTVEGLRNVVQVQSLAKAQGVDMPIIEEVYQVLYKKRSPLEAVNKLLNRRIMLAQS